MYVSRACTSEKTALEESSGVVVLRPGRERELPCATLSGPRSLWLTDVMPVRCPSVTKRNARCHKRVSLRPRSLADG